LTVSTFGDEIVGSVVMEVWAEGLELGGREMKRKLFGCFLSAAMFLALTPLARAQSDQTDLSNAINEVTIPEGTEFKLDLHTSVNSRTAKPGDRILTTLIDPVYVEDQQVLPKGVRVDGHISEVQAARRRGRGGDLSIAFDTVEMPNGQKIAILGSLTEVFSSANGGDSDVGVEGDLKGRGPSRKMQAAVVVGATAAGATGGIGPGIAAGVGGLVAALVLPHGKQAALSAGSLIGMRLDQDVSFNLPRSIAETPAAPAPAKP
jgi:hypothetical protein